MLLWITFSTIFQTIKHFVIYRNWLSFWTQFSLFCPWLIERCSLPSTNTLSSAISKLSTFSWVGIGSLINFNKHLILCQWGQREAYNTQNFPSLRCKSNAHISLFLTLFYFLFCSFIASCRQLGSTKHVIRCNVLTSCCSKICCCLCKISRKSWEYGTVSAAVSFFCFKSTQISALPRNFTKQCLHLAFLSRQFAYDCLDWQLLFPDKWLRTSNKSMLEEVLAISCNTLHSSPCEMPHHFCFTKVKFSTRSFQIIDCFEQDPFFSSNFALLENLRWGGMTSPSVFLRVIKVVDFDYFDLAMLRAWRQPSINVILGLLHWFLCLLVCGIWISWILLSLVHHVLNLNVTRISYHF